jgi:large subunit ribosomal protein L18
MINKKESRIRRAQKTRHKINELRAKRLVVFRSNVHIYAQIFDESGSKVLVSASSNEKEIALPCANGGNVAAAKFIGETIAARAKDAGIQEVAFDRSGFKYHGRIEALANSAREHGLVF